MKRLFILTLIAIFALLLPQQSQAHSPDQSYIYINVYKSAMDGRFEVTVRDLNKALGLNLPEPATLADIEPYKAQIQNYLKQHTTFSADGQTFEIVFKDLEILAVDDMEQDFLLFHYDIEDVDAIPSALDVRYDGFFETDDKHRGMFLVGYNWKAGVINNEAMISLIFSPNNTQQQLSLDEMSLWQGFVALVKLGIWHIWIGLDHILFIIALILPAVVRRRETLSDFSTVDQNVSANYSNSWLPVAKFKPAFLYILKIVTFFTLAHSITLALAALGVVNLSSRVVESIIAFSIALAALHNITPIFKGKEWLIAFVFGLFHGFGFASVLGEKGLEGDFMILSLLGFNIGVEIGQVLIICLAFPVLFLIRKLFIYPRVITYGSVLLILIALYWVVERAFDIELAWGRYLGL
ncbi:MAG: HupE/UreJ family protein [Bacteroidota bacterium]